MKLGAFSISLAVKDIHASKEFYEKLGFDQFVGDIDQNWLLMKNGNTVIGLFQRMFEQNILTFNPGWDQDANPLDDFTDIRELQSNFKEKGLAISNPVDETSSGPASFSIIDPDGNTILFDQHR